MTNNDTEQVLIFRKCTLVKLDKTFGLKQVFNSPILQDWLNSSAEISDFERQSLLFYQSLLIRNVHDWNEQELSLHFIGPMFSLVYFTTDKFNLFAERSLATVIACIELRGDPDGMIASGKREPEMPYFCFQEYKHPPFIPPESGGTEGGDGDPDGQCLAAMLAAQALNQNDQPIYGCFVLSRDWHFMVLQGQEYTISEPYTATREDIFDIFRILKGLKQIISELVEQNS